MADATVDPSGGEKSHGLHDGCGPERSGLDVEGICRRQIGPTGGVKISVNGISIKDKSLGTQKKRRETRESFSDPHHVVRDCPTSTENTLHGVAGHPNDHQELRGNLPLFEGVEVVDSFYEEPIGAAFDGKAVGRSQASSDAQWWDFCSEGGYRYQSCLYPL